MISSGQEPEYLDIGPFYLLLAAMVSQARKDLRLTHRGRHGVTRPTHQEIREAREFLSWAEESFKDRLHAS